MAPCGHSLAQTMQPVHFTESTVKVMSDLQTPAGQRLSITCASYSSRKYLMVDSTGLGAVPPRPQSEASLMTSPRSPRSSISSRLPRPSVMSVRISSILSSPSRQGTHLPHDSSVRNFTKYLAMSTMQLSSSMTIMPPEPIIDPASANLSKSTGRSIMLSGMQPPDGPPV